MQVDAALWRLAREDRGPALLVALLPLLLALPRLLGLMHGDPMLYTADFLAGHRAGFLQGQPYIDPNSGFTTQALGYRAALEWLSGSVPWWNYYTGVGLPLAGEYQPGAFFPLTLLLLLPNGMMWLHVAEQTLAGLATYALLRQLGTLRIAATAGAVLFAFNGTFAWFSDAPASPIAFLPLMLLGIERARACALTATAGGWRTFALAMALSLLAAFPETAYAGGLLVLAWAVLRLWQLPAPRRMGFAARVAAGGLAGIAIAAPQLHAFAHYLTLAFLGGHGGEFANAALPRASMLPSLVAPHVYGPIFGFSHLWPLLGAVWGSIGGFVTLAIVVTAAHGVFARRDALAWLLVGWCLLTIGKTFGMQPATWLMNQVPGVASAAYARYAQPSWEMAFIVLAAFGIDALARAERQRVPWRATAAFATAALCTAFYWAWQEWPNLQPHVALRNCALGALAWAAASAVAIAVMIARLPGARAARGVAVLLAFDAMLMTTIPTLSSPRDGAINTAALGFLRANIGLQRFYTLGPLQPNYGAYFGIASINHNYLPLAQRWIDFVQAHLDRHAGGGLFVGNDPRPPGAASQEQELRRNLASYEAVGVKYVMARAGANPLAGVPGVKQAYADHHVTILELPAPRPYFEALGATCTLVFTARDRVVAECARPALLVRRELFFPGWRARAAAQDIPIAEHEALFQSVALPAGRTELRFDYAPPHVVWSWLAALAGLAAIAAPAVLRRARR